MLKLPESMACDHCNTLVKEVVLNAQGDIFCSMECMEAYEQEKRPPFIAEDRVEEVL